MTPQEFYEKCVKDIFKQGTVDTIKQSRNYDASYIKKLTSVITDKKEKFPLPVLDYTESQEEGLHRMYVAGELFGWDHKFPVLVVEWANKDKRAKEVDDRRKHNIESNIQSALRTTLNWTFESEDDFKENLQNEMNHEFLGYSDETQPFKLEIKNNKIYVTVDDVTVEEDSSKLKMKPAPIEESIDELTGLEGLDRILKSKFNTQFKTIDEPTEGPCYLLPDGNFFYYGLAGHDYLFHGMEIKYLVDKGLVDNDTAQDLAREGKLWPFIKVKDTIVLNDGYYRSEECVIRLLTTHPTTAQLNGIKEWIEYIQTRPYFEEQIQVTTWSNERSPLSNGWEMYNMKDDGVDTNYIMNRIRLFYSSGKLLA